VDPRGVHELDRQVAVRDARRLERGERGLAQLVRRLDEVDLDQGL